MREGAAFIATSPASASIEQQQAGDARRDHSAPRGDDALATSVTALLALVEEAPPRLCRGHWFAPKVGP